jgi:energy-coupling factor transporter ATP-binding protein EcfA2
MLTRLYADNYKCLSNFEFEPKRSQLVIGRNGAGKSAALDVLSLLRDFSVRGTPCEDRLVGATRTRWQPQVVQQRFELDVTQGNSDYRYTLVVDEWGTPRRPRVLLECVECDANPVFLFKDGIVNLYNDRYEHKVEYPFDWHRSALATIAARSENQKLTAFKRWLGGVVHIQINPWAMSARSEQESTEPARDLSNFADWYRHLLLDSSASVQEAISALKDVIPGLEALDAKEAGLNVRVVQATIRAARDATPMRFALHDLSEGQRVLIALYILMTCALAPESAVLIDEPDNFVALAEIQPWLMKVLDRVEEQNAQIIFVSHHPELLNQLAAQGGTVFDRPDGGPTRAVPFEAASDAGLTPAELIARGWERA